jgi:hypothetical protein
MNSPGRPYCRQDTILKDYGMAKVRHFPQGGYYGSPDMWMEGEIQLSPPSETSAKWTSQTNFNFFEIKGESLQFMDGVLIGGHVDSITFNDAEGLDLARITGSFDAAKLGNALEKGGIDGLTKSIMRGDDRMIGSEISDAFEGFNGSDRLFGRGGDDFLYGMRGNDKLTGGAGSDTFWYDWNSEDGISSGNDIVTDFDAKGGGDKQDYVYGLDIAGIHRSGENTVIEYEDGGSLTLLDVDRHDISKADFTYPI